MKMNKLTTWIAFAMLAGIAVGYLCHALAPDAAAAKEIAGYFSIFADIFLRLIKMIIAPLVFATLVAGLAGMGDAKAVGRIGGKALGWFMGASLCSLMIGLVIANLLRPGEAVSVPLPEAGTATNLKTAALNLKDFITHVFPKSIFEAMAHNEILQILVFALFFGLALGKLKDQTAKGLLKTIEEIVHVTLQVTDYVMRFAPVGVFAAVDPTRLGRLMAYDWPGNVREPRNVADRCMLGIAAGFPPFATEVPAGPRPLAEMVEAFERALIADALARHGDSLARSAEALGVAKTTLHDKIRKYRLADQA